MDKLCLEITYSVLILVSLGEPVPVNSPNFPVKDLVIIAYRASLGAICILLKPEKLSLKFLFGGSFVCGGSLVTQPIYTVSEQFALIGVFFGVILALSLLPLASLHLHPWLNLPIHPTHHHE